MVDYDFFDLFDLEGCIFGAPNVAQKQLKKIADESKVFAEDNGSNNRFSESNEQTSGIRLRFRTNSKHMKVHFELGRKYAYQRVMVASSSGFDVFYVKDDVYHHLAVLSPDELELKYEATLELPENDCIELYFPTYNTIRAMTVGIQKGCIIEPIPYKNRKKVIFYGNSCTQGGGTSRSGNSYPNIVSRMLSIDIINYSFNASCRGEKCIAEEISAADAAAFVIDYQYNSAIDEFKERYEPFYRIIRENNMGAPIIFIDTLSETAQRNTSNQSMNSIIRSMICFIS